MLDSIKEYLLNNFVFIDELNYILRAQKLDKKEFDRKYRGIFDEIIEKGNKGQRKFAKDMNDRGLPCAFAGGWTKKYKRNAHVNYDKTCKLNFYYYKPHFQKKIKMYLKRKWNKKVCRVYLQNVLMEQDMHSPHFYFTDTVLNSVKNGGSILDIGAAEGNFTLELISEIDKAYLFEPDKEWLFPLKKTFQKYHNKIVMCEKYVSDIVTEESITIDDYFGDNIPTDIKLIKLDIEGYEQKALTGMRKTLEKNPGAILLVCIYHKQNDEQDIVRYIRELGEYDIVVRKGYMFFALDDKMEYPYLRHGVIECKLKR